MMWNKTARKGRYLLIDHLGKNIRIAVYITLAGAKNALAGTYSDEKMYVEQSYAGFSSAAC